MDYISEIENARDEKQLEQIRVKFLGKSGLLTKQLQELSALAIDERKTKGAELNILKSEIQKKIKEKKEEFEKKDIKDCDIDYTYPYYKDYPKTHPITASINLLNNIFARMGFEKISGPDIETSYYNFDALNIPESHPARESHDTFYMEDGDYLLRTHVTALQIRLLEQLASNKDVRAFSIGRVYRNDSHDATHASMFHQIEGVIIEDGVTMQHLKGCIEFLLKNFFGKEIPTRFRPSYFPFTEPSCEIDIPAKVEGERLVITDMNSSNFMEIGGCGIIHPKILERFGLQDKQAFAFGMGLERWLMLKMGINNFHALYENKLPWLKKYGGV